MKRSPGELHMHRFVVKVAILTGLIFALLLCASLIYLSLAPERRFFTDPGSGQDVFHRLLQGYDTFFGSTGAESRLPRQGLSQDQVGILDSMLNQLEHNSQGVEAWLSVLKRRRILAFRDPRFLPTYQAAAGRAAKAFPWSQPIAAIASEALLFNAPLKPEAGELAKGYASLMTESRFAPLALAIRVLTGDLESPAKAQAVRADELLAVSLPLMRNSLSGDEEARLTADLGLVLLLKGDYTGASSRIRRFASENQPPALQILAAEYFYDFGEPLRAAEIFSRLDREEATLRSADALWLGGRREAAQNIWRILASGTEPFTVDPALRLRSLYNLAATVGSSRDRETASWLAGLYALGEAVPTLRAEPCYYFGLIRYTRPMEPRRAIAIQEAGEPQNPLLDLELLRRRAELWSMERTVAETWLLLGRHPEDEALYQWGAWYFDRQRKYEETRVLIRTAGRQGMESPWLKLNAALRLMQEGNLGEAEEQLRAVGEAGPWQVSANLGRILESRHAPRPALEQYEAAASLVKDPSAASRIQLRIAGCFRALGQTDESRQALERSLELNPDNLPARLELQRMEGISSPSL
jgi:tetratricopeptide (TPR) repeat protein